VTTRRRPWVRRSSTSSRRARANALKTELSKASAGRNVFALRLQRLELGGHGLQRERLLGRQIALQEGAMQQLEGSVGA
jgi:hypothetical protein